MLTTGPSHLVGQPLQHRSLGGSPLLGPRRHRRLNRGRVALSATDSLPSSVNAEATVRSPALLARSSDTSWSMTDPTARGSAPSGVSF